MGVATSIVLVAAGLWSWGNPRPARPDAPPSIFEHGGLIADTATASGAMDKSVIRAVIRDHINEIKSCYDPEVAADPFLFGQAMVQFTIAATGEVIASVLQNTTLQNPRVESCAVLAVRKWRFPKPIGGGIVIVSYPFLFTPADPMVLAPGSNGADRVELQPLGSRFVLHRSTSAESIPSNGLVAITERGLLLVDTAWTPAQTEAILRWGEDRLKQHWIGAVLTHSHDDRAGGLDALLRRNVPVSALDLTVAKLEQRNVRGVKPLFSAKTGTLDDDRGFEAFYPGPGHTTDNIVVKFDSLLFGGCLIKSAEADDLGFTGDADLKAWPAAVRRVQERYGKTTVVPGHGPVDQIGAALDHTLRLLEKAR